MLDQLKKRGEFIGQLLDSAEESGFEKGEKSGFEEIAIKFIEENQRSALEIAEFCDLPLDRVLELKESI